MTNHIQHTKLPHRQNCNTFFETMKSTLKKSCSIRPFKVDSLFCIQKNCSLYAGARKIKHGLGKKHGLYLSKSHIYITLVDKFFINLHRKMTLKFPIMGKLLDHKGWLQNTMKNFKCIFSAPTEWIFNPKKGLSSGKWEQSTLCVVVWVITKPTRAGIQNRQSTLNGLTIYGKNIITANTGCCENQAGLDLVHICPHLSHPHTVYMYNHQLKRPHKYLTTVMFSKLSDPTFWGIMSRSRFISNIFITSVLPFC